MDWNVTTLTNFGALYKVPFIQGKTERNRDWKIVPSRQDNAMSARQNGNYPKLRYYIFASADSRALRLKESH